VATLKNEFGNMKTEMQSMQVEMQNMQTEMRNMKAEMQNMQTEIQSLRQAVLENTGCIDTLFNAFGGVIQFKTDIENFKADINKFKDEASAKIENLVEVTNKIKEEYGRHDIDLRIMKEKIGILI